MWHNTWELSSVGHPQSSSVVRCAVEWRRIQIINSNLSGTLSLATITGESVTTDDDLPSDWNLIRGINFNLIT